MNHACRFFIKHFERHVLWLWQGTRQVHARHAKLWITKKTTNLWHQLGGCPAWTGLGHWASGSSLNQALALGLPQWGKFSAPLSHSWFPVSPSLHYRAGECSLLGISGFQHLKYILCQGVGGQNGNCCASSRGLDMTDQLTALKCLTSGWPQ